MGDRYIRSQNESYSQSQSQRSMAKHGEAWTKSHDRRSIWYIDANNLYGYALMQKLPYTDFEYSKTTLDKVLNTSDDCDYGYWLMCDLEYTNECEERTSNFQLIPHGREVENNELGYKQRPPTSTKSKRLILDQNNKYEYPLHYRKLKFVDKMGIKVTKVHRIIKFKQDYIIRDYIELNTKMRAEAKTEPEKDIFKLMKNSLFAKNCENPLKYLGAKILTDDYEILKAVSKPTCKDVIRYENYTLIEFYKKEIQCDKPIYLGSPVLELSKLDMYKFFYNVLNPSLKDLMLPYIDTDSFVLSSEGNVDNEHMYLSNQDKPIKTNNKIPDKVKHELGSKVIEEFVILKPKTYSIKNYGAKEKGIKKGSNEKHEEYYGALIDNKEKIVEESSIQKVGRCMATIKISKRSLSNSDDKRFYVNNIKIYPLDESMYLFKRDLVNKISQRTSSAPN